MLSDYIVAESAEAVSIEAVSVIMPVESDIAESVAAESALSLDELPEEHAATDIEMAMARNPNLNAFFIVCWILVLNNVQGLIPGFRKR
ncbi:MAG: hypothetical protein INR69_06635 [Mucilaginibacter polytrichastri]|nr:hypothetical protein [Mucilaginibacter polytrichastri]